MTQLTAGPGPDGTHLVLTSDDGQTYRLELTPEIRRMVRETRPDILTPTEPDVPSLSPREIQRRIRGGLDPADVAELTGADLGQIERYAAPVLAERAFVVKTAQAVRVGHASDAPQLAELVAHRLATRGVQAPAWIAWRAESEPWSVAVDFVVDGKSTRALWRFDPATRALESRDAEARWLTETELLDAPIPARHLSVVDEDAPLVESRPAPVTGAHPIIGGGDTPTELLLEDLGSRRGTREDPVDLDEDGDEDDDLFDGFGPLAGRSGVDVSFVATAPEPDSGSDRKSTDLADGQVVKTGDPSDARPTDAEPRTRRASRSKVPSWDEIVFGAKND